MKSKINIPGYNLGSYSIPDECVKNVCVDIGANIGCFTLQQASFFAVIHYYEPFEECYNIINEKVKELKNVTGWREAVYFEDDIIIPIVAHENLDAGSNAIKTDAVNEAWSEEIGTVKTVSLPTILERAGGHIDYLKVDCETSEYYFLVDQDLAQIDYIGIELHWQIGQEKYDRLLAHLAKTHNVVGDCSWTWGINKEVLFKLKSL